MIAAALLISGLGAIGPNHLNDYSNVRYGYSVCYPVFMRALPEAPNGDGRAFKAKDGGSLTVWGENNVTDETLASQAKTNVKVGEAVTYTVRRPRWVVQSGTGRGYIFWRKIYQRDDQFVTVDLQYPTAVKAFYDPVVKAVSSCFRLGKPAF